MFRLEKLEINGFKSFADRTTVVFGEGITAVVGPNGCGKSNIADAISWVLGEQSAKSLRGGKMEDVIFNGTRDRKPTGMAEVVLTMIAIADISGREAADDASQDETRFQDAIMEAERAAETAKAIVSGVQTDVQQSGGDQAAAGPDLGSESDPESPISGTASNLTATTGDRHSSAGPGQQSAPDDVAESGQPRKAWGPHQTARRKRVVVSLAAGERVTIGRRLYRTGDSDYLINGRVCLLRDVQDLFAGTGLGGAHYAIIEQGKIGQILSSKPLDRRALIEEAAGTTKFKSRKRLAELKLESARQNLTRVNDIISEIERQVNSLKRQAQKARRYRRLKEELRALLKLVYAADFRRLSEAALRDQDELAKARDRQSLLDAEVAEQDARLKEASGEGRSVDEILGSERQKLSALEIEAGRVRSRRAFEEKEIGELAARVEENNRTQSGLVQRLTALDAEIERKGESLREINAQVTAEQARLVEHESAHQAATARLRASEDQIERLRQQMMVEIGVTERLKNNISSLGDSIHRLELKDASLESELGRALERLGAARDQQSSVRMEVDAGEALIRNINEKLRERNGTLAEVRERASVLQREMSGVQAERAAAERLLGSLEDINTRHAYYSDAVQHILSPEQSKQINALGTLADFVEADPHYERLIESLFSRELECILVPTIDDALLGVEYLKTEGLGRGGFLVVGLHGAEGDPSEYFIESDADSPRQPDRHAQDDCQGKDISLLEQKHSLPSDSPSVGPVASEPGDEYPTRHYSGREPVEEPAGVFGIEVLRAIDLMGLRPEIRSIVERAFPEKCAAAVVPDIEAALHQSIEKGWGTFVTLDGEQVVNGRLIISGAPAGKEGASLLGIKREIKELRDKAGSARHSEEVVAGAVTIAKTELDRIESETSRLNSDLHQHEKLSAARESDLASTTRDLERAEQHVRVIQSEREQAAQELSELTSRLEKLAADLSAAEAARVSTAELYSSAAAEQAAIRAQVEQASQALSAARAEAAARAERARAFQTEMKRLAGESEELNSRINAIRLDLYQAQGRIEELTTSHTNGEAELARFGSEIAALLTGIGHLEERRAELRTAVDELDASLASLRQAATAAHEARGQVEIGLTRIQAEAEHLSRSCLSELGVSLQETAHSEAQQSIDTTAEKVSLERVGHPGVEASGGDEPAAADGQDSRSEESDDAVPDAAVDIATVDIAAVDVEEARRRVEELRAKLDEIGSVNMMALEELEEAEARFKFLTTQRDDILESIKGTEQALGEIRRRSRERFRHAFARINENFQRMFVELFGGGRGEMVLIDEDDVLESGIDLIAQPPGKRLQNVLLLSGGEKAMTAIALVLAIFEFRPSPFCILDEVDAPLDEVNVGRFSGKVHEMSQETQFLMITHNKRSMEAARALYGVTMEEPGVSKLVSVRFQ